MIETSNVNYCIVLTGTVFCLVIMPNFINFLWCQTLDFLHKFLFIKICEFNLRLN